MRRLVLAGLYVDGVVECASDGHVMATRLECERR